MTADSNRKIVFYDGSCGLCHRFVRFAINHDRAESLFFAPLQGQTFSALRAELPGLDLAAPLPDSVVYVENNQQIFFRSRAVAAALRTLASPCPLYASCIEIIPAGIADSAYRLIASLRKYLFPKPDNLCPLVPADYAHRFLA